jgi:hypothetical protein
MECPTRSLTLPVLTGALKRSCAPSTRCVFDGGAAKRVLLSLKVWSGPLFPPRSDWSKRFLENSVLICVRMAKGPATLVLSQQFSPVLLSEISVFP